MLTGGSWPSPPPVLKYTAQSKTDFYKRSKNENMVGMFALLNEDNLKSIYNAVSPSKILKK